MQQSVNEQPTRVPRVRFGMDLQTTLAGYRQALRGARLVDEPIPDQQPVTNAAAAGAEQGQP